MSSIFDKLNLRPQERRVVVIVSLVVFVVLNLWLVWPNRGMLGRVQKQIDETRKQLRKFQEEIDRQPYYSRQLRELQGQGQFIATEEQALRISQEVNNQAALTGVTIISSTPAARSGARTNAFFDEQSLQISITTGEEELVKFLYNLAARESLTRVRSLTLGPDTKHERLQGNITLVKSFQKKPPSKATAAPPAAAGPYPVPAAPGPAATTPKTVTAAAKVVAPSAANPTQTVAKVTAPAGAAKPTGTNVSSTATSTNFLKRWLQRIF